MLKLHPYCAFFDRYLSGPLQELADDIKANGQHDTILTFPMPDAKPGDEPGILDGRNRYLACELAGVEPRCEPFEGDALAALNYVKSKNLLPGRYVTPMQRAEIATKMRAEMLRLTGGGETANVPSQRDMADLFSVSRSTMQRAEKKEKEKSQPAPPPKETPEPASWSVDEIKKDEQLLKAFTNIGACYGVEDSKAIRNGVIGLTKAEIIYMGNLPVEPLRNIRDLVIGERWKPKTALEFINKMPTDDTTVQELKYLCRATKGQFYTGDFDGFTVTIKNNRAIKR